MAIEDFQVRLATNADVPLLEDLVSSSIRDLAVKHYDARQIASSLRYLYGIDSQLIDDGTYLVVECNNAVVACGGWSWRRTPFGGDRVTDVRDEAPREPGKDPAVIRAFFVNPAWVRRGLGRMILEACERAAGNRGFDRYELTATAMGVKFYTACGYRLIAPRDITLPDGQVLPHVTMAKP